MQMLWPTPMDDVDVFAVYAEVDREPVGARPWVVVNMIASVDGAAADAAGRSGGLSGPGDRQAFMALRAIADVIVAGGTTVRSEDYGPPRTSPAVQTVRVARGQAARPRLAVVSASLRFDPDMRLFSDPACRPFLVTTASSEAAARDRLAPVADLIVAGEGRVDWAAALAALRSQAGADVVLVEGGPLVNGQLWAGDLVDELCLTIAPALAGGGAPRIAHGPPLGGLRPLALGHLLEDDGFLLARYVVERGR